MCSAHSDWDARRAIEREIHTHTRAWRNEKPADDLWHVAKVGLRSRQSIKIISLRGSLPKGAPDVCAHPGTKKTVSASWGMFTEVNF